MLGRNVTNNTHIESKTKFRSSVKPKPWCENICFNLLGVSDGWGYLHQNNISKQKRLKLTEISNFLIKPFGDYHLYKPRICFVHVDISTICATSCSREMFVSRHSCQEVKMPFKHLHVFDLDFQCLLLRFPLVFLLSCSSPV